MIEMSLFSRNMGAAAIEPPFYRVSHSLIKTSVHYRMVSEAKNGRTGRMNSEVLKDALGPQKLLAEE